MTSRLPFVCGNWKMNKTVAEAAALIDALLPNVEPLAGVEIGIAPTFTALSSASKRLSGTKLALCAQNCHHEAQGAFTGEISAPMLKEIGVRYVIIGHSERRQYFGETNEGCAKKITAALVAGMRAIYCLGETLAEREANRTLAVVTEQFNVGLAGFVADRIADLVVAYEPVWAIGTGRTATPDQAQEVHAHLRKLCSDRFGPEAADHLRIQYGGSVNAENAKDLFSQADIDGGLIGGASLKADTFTAICKAAMQA
jgi:triosephosphate isomerase (TIM)